MAMTPAIINMTVGVISAVCRLVLRNEQNWQAQQNKTKADIVTYIKGFDKR